MCTLWNLDISEQILELHRGQGMDIYWRDSVHCPSEDEYKTMVIRSKYTLSIVSPLKLYDRLMKVLLPAFVCLKLYMYSDNIIIQTVSEHVVQVHNWLQ